MSKALKGCIYQHFKENKLYLIEDMARDSDHLGYVVVYRALYDNEYGDLWVRPLGEFEDKVTLDNGERVDRFKLVGDLSRRYLKRVE